MQVVVDRPKAMHVVDTLIERWRHKKVPYDSERAALPQDMIPDHIRNDKALLARFYFFVCLHMRGGIKSRTVFKQFIKLHDEHPDLFTASGAAALAPERISQIIREYIGWNANVVGEFWQRNATLLHGQWSGEVLSLIDGVASYDEALSRMANKKTDSGGGFAGFQHKMVSMLLYFLDRENMLPVRFPYPSPADFHHYRLLMATRAVEVTTNGGPIRFNEKISKPIRDMLMWYLENRKGVTSVELSDALWLFSLVLCGESPVNLTRESTPEVRTDQLSLPHVLMQHKDQGAAINPRQWPRSRREQYLATCGQCPFEHMCAYAIPAQPYYRKGILELRNRPTMQEVYRAP